MTVSYPTESGRAGDGRGRILLVDDEAFVRSALRRTLRRDPYEIDEADGPRQALELLETRRYDLIVADHLMPQMTGLELLSIVRRKWSETVRIILTGHADVTTAIGAINEGGIYRFLTKPWDDLELRLTVFNAMERRALERENQRLLQLLRAPARRGHEEDGAAAQAELRAIVAWREER